MSNKRMLVFNDGGNQGVKDFDGHIIIEPLYYEIYGLQKPFITVRVGEKDHYKEGLITKNGMMVIPAKFNRISWCKDNYIICCRDDYCEMLQLMSK